MLKYKILILYFILPLPIIFIIFFLLFYLYLFLLFYFFFYYFLFYYFILFYYYIFIIYLTINLRKHANSKESSSWPKAHAFNNPSCGL